MAFGKNVGDVLSAASSLSSFWGVAKRQRAEMLRFSSFKFVSVVSN